MQSKARQASLAEVVHDQAKYTKQAEDTGGMMRKGAQGYKP
jgi:hypothetical protein